MIILFKFSYINFFISSGYTTIKVLGISNFYRLFFFPFTVLYYTYLITIISKSVSCKLVVLTSDVFQRFAWKKWKCKAYKASVRENKILSQQEMLRPNDPLSKKPSKKNSFAPLFFRRWSMDLHIFARDGEQICSFAVIFFLMGLSLTFF